MLALGLEKDIILVVSSRTKIPSDLVRQEVIFYAKDIEEFRKKLTKCMKNLKK